jgi:formylglycine-generating enzyme required for sulfatase activity
VTLAAWRRLGGAGGEGTAAISPHWPTRAGELVVEVALRARLTELLKGVRDTAARDAATAELKAQGPERWRRFTNAAKPESLAEAVNNRAAMGVNLSEVAKLDPPARFNLALYTARAAAGDATPTVIRTVTDELRGAAEGVKDRPAIADLLTKLSRINEPEPMARALAGKSPPAYQLPIAKSLYHLDFVRVAPKGMRPFYLSTTEVSFGAFVDAVNAAGNWPDANALLGNIPTAVTGPGATQKGPQLWGRPTSTSGDQPITRFVNWRYDNVQQFNILKRLRPTPRFNANRIAPEFGGDPTENHPMQQVPAQAALYAAALMNCRLPTTAEWLEANASQSAAPTDPKPNRRDETWRAQQDNPEASSQWPAGGMDGVFWPKRPPATPRVLLDGEGKRYDDGTAFFRPVNVGGGRFVNLVGNVAEFTCDAPEAFEAAEAGKSAASMAAFAKAYGTRISVIGGSAFSDPELKVDVPYQVNSPAEPYCDVGFRLAFTAPVASPAERLQVILAEQQFLPLNAVAGK